MALLLMVEGNTCRSSEVFVCVCQIPARGEANYNKSKEKGSDEADLDLADCDLVPASQVCVSENFIAYFSKSFEKYK